MTTRGYICSLFAAVLLISCAAPQPPFQWERGAVPDPYPLDEESRRAGRSGAPDCPDVQLLDYQGDIVPYDRPVKVNPFFRERLQQFELVVRDVATRFYGRPPSAILQWGVYNCRRVRGKAKLSEHGLGNAIDVWGFEFVASDAADGSGSSSFRVVLEEHWGGGSGLAARHGAFLQTLVRELTARPDIFRGILGPGFPGHDDHFHFDMGPRRFLAVHP